MVFDSIKKAFSSKDDEDRASLSKKVQAYPNDPQIRQKLGIFMLRAGEVVEGLDQLARSAIIYEKDGFAGKAIAVIRQILKHDPKNNDFNKWLIRLLAAEGLAADAHAEIRRAAADSSRFSSDEHRIDFFRQVSGFAKDSPLPYMLISDIFSEQRRRLDAASELKKAVLTKGSAEMQSEIAERIRVLAGQGENDFAIFESCGFLYAALGMKGEAISLLSRVVSYEEEAGRKDRAAEMKEILKEIHVGWNPSKAGAFSFMEAISARAEAAAPPPAPVDVDAAPKAAVESPPSSGLQVAESATSLRAVENTKEVLKTEEVFKAEEAFKAEDVFKTEDVFKAEELFDTEEEDEEDEEMVRDALGRLQAKVHEEVGESDLETRYNLGIAYKEMGLLDEAAIEFRLSMRNPNLMVGASSLLADTLVAKGDANGAFAVLDEVLEAPTVAETHKRDILYHKAVLLSLGGREEEAGNLFLFLAEKFPGYRDVDARAKRYRF